MYRLHITENNDTTLSKVKPPKECFQCIFTVMRRNIMITDANRIQFCCKAALKRQ